MEARIIKLEGPVNVTASTFEEAFGDFSELRGRGRARRQSIRQARRMKRIADRAERKRARQAMRAEQQEARQSRKDVRKQRRVTRKAMGQDEEGDEEETSDNTTSQEPTTTPRGAAPDEPTGGTPAMDETETTEESDIEAGEEEAMEDESSADGINYEDLGSTDDLLTLENDDFYSYMDDYSGADGKPEKVRAKINPSVKNSAMKAEWNKELVSRLKEKVNHALSVIEKLKLTERKTGKSQANNIIRYQKHINTLRAKIDNALNRALSFDGALDDYTGADDYSEAAGRRGKSVEKRRRNAEVKAARREARKARVKSRIATAKSKGLAKKGLNGEDVIPVDEQLQPEFDTQRITVPAADLSTGVDGKTGLIALDEANDIDAPAERQIELKSGIDGSATSGNKINWLGIGIGVAIAGVAIWYGRKKKLF